MKHLSSIAILIISMFFFTEQALCNTLDTSGTAAAKEFKLINVKLVKAGKKPNFEIQLNATAVVHAPNMPGWPDQVYLVTAFGGYNYDNGGVTESIYVGIIGPGSMYNSERLFLYQGACDENPWIHGNSTCYTVNVEKDLRSVSGWVINYPTVYPMSANYVPNHLHDTLVNWENTYPPEDLSDWNPYAGSESSNELEIESPSAYQVIPENAANFQLAVKSNISPAPQVLEMRWERLDDVGGWQGDIKLPEGSKMWQPFQGPNSKSWSNFPLTIPAFSSNKSELYRVSIRGAGKTGWSSWRSFWIGKPVVNIDKVKEMVELGSKTQQKVHSAMFKKFLEEKKVLDTKVARSEFEKKSIKEDIRHVAFNVFEVLSPKENQEYKLSVNLKVVTPKKNKIHFRLAKRMVETNKWDTDWMMWVAGEDELVNKGTYYLWEKNLSLEPTDYYFIARPNDPRIALGPAASDSDGIQFTVKKLQVGKHVAKKKEGADVSSIGQLKKKMVASGDKDTIKPVLLLPAVKTRSLSNSSPLALKFRHDVRQKEFKYEFEKWDQKRKRWVKTSEPRMIRSQTSKGSDMVMTTAYFRFKTPGKYRWGTAGLSPQKRQEIVVGEAAVKQVADKASSKKIIDKGKSAKLESSLRNEKLPAGMKKSPSEIKKPSIWFDLGTKPAPKPIINRAFNLVIGVRNIGAVKNGNSPSNKAVVKLTCKALNGGNCKKLLGDPVVPTIEPGKTKTLNLRSVFKATKGGKYRVSMVLDPAPKTPANVKIRMSNLRKSYSFDFNIIEYTFPKNETIKKQPKKIKKQVQPKVKTN